MWCDIWLLATRTSGLTLITFVDRHQSEGTKELACRRSNQDDTDHCGEEDY